MTRVDTTQSNIRTGLGMSLTATTAAIAKGARAIPIALATSWLIGKGLDKASGSLARAVAR